MAKKMTQEEWEARMRLKGMDPYEVQGGRQAPQEGPRTTQFVRTIEQTSKKWKAMKVIGFLLLFTGIALVTGSSPDPSGEPSGAAMTGVLLVIGGPCLYIFARVMAWWHHG